MKYGILLSIFFMFTSCKYVVHYTQPLDTPKEKMRFVVVGNNEGLNLAIENALMLKGCRVQTNIVSNYYTRTVDHKTRTEKGSVMSSITKSLENKGKVGGSKELFEEIKEWNNVKDETIRVRDFRTLLKEQALAANQMSKIYDITHILEVQVDSALNDKGTVQCTAKVSKLPENKVEFVFYLEAPSSQLNKIIADGYGKGNGIKTNAGSMGNQPLQYKNLKVANYLADLIIK